MSDAFVGRRPLPKCSAAGCRLWVWNEAPSHTEWTRGMAMTVRDGPSVPVSDKCWYHHHGKPVPEGAK